MKLKSAHLVAALLVNVLASPCTYAATAVPDANTLAWHSIAFGQSTDVNFSSNVLAEKIGTNDVTINGKKLLPGASADLSAPITIESRGGKIANTHDGLTFFYTQLPANVNFTLQAVVTVEQFGPENGGKPAAQEGAGLLVRDIIGAPRQEPLKPGYEEFPAAANMVMNAIMTQDKTSHNIVKLQAISREGVIQPWGNAGAKITRDSFQENIDIAKTPSFQMKLERTNDSFITSYAPLGSNDWVSKTVNGADLVTQLDKDNIYVGFFASRNAKIIVSDASLILSPANTKTSPKFQVKAYEPRLEVASAQKTGTEAYSVQARANYAGHLTIYQDGKILVKDAPLQAGAMFAKATRVPAAASEFKLVFTPSEGPNLSAKEATFTVEKVAYADASNLYVSPQGKADNQGTQASPIDLTSAIAALSPGGTLWLADGDYPYTIIPASASGTAKAVKNLVANGKAVFHGLQLSASYWHIKGIEVTDKSFLIFGSHNKIEEVVAHHADDTGIWVGSPEGIGRPLWASHNLILNSESYSNQDPGKINADGFAVKMRVGEGNILRGCFSHDNIDDGYDLFNKIEDGANGVVVIENSIAMNNTSNGFKMGGEGQPVAHQVRNSLAVGNVLDGFTDNFNPGALVVENNIALDNQRFNFIFRPSPYSGPEKQGIFKNNLSLRTKPGTYDDAVVGRIDNSNYFILLGRSVNSEGKLFDVKVFKSLQVPATFSRDSQGNFIFGDFLQQQK